MNTLQLVYSAVYLLERSTATSRKMATMYSIEASPFFSPGHCFQTVAQWTWLMFTIPQPLFDPFDRQEIFCDHTVYLFFLISLLASDTILCPNL